MNNIYMNFNGVPVACNCKGRYVKGKVVTKILNNILESDDLWAAQAVLDTLKALEIITLEEHEFITNYIAGKEK